MYIRNRGNSCAPVAFLNALQWMGLRTTERQLRRLKLVLHTSRTGTFRGPVAWLARHVGWRRMNKPSIKKFERELERGNALYVCCKYEYFGHAYLIVGQTACQFKCVGLLGKARRHSKKSIAKEHLNTPMVYVVNPIKIGPKLTFDIRYRVG